MTDTPFPPNPYIVGSPLVGHKGFYGRQDVLDFMRDVIAAEQQNVVVFYGQRRVGKTSLLHQMARTLKSENQMTPVHFDLEGKAQKSLGEVLYLLAQTIARSLKLKRPELAQFDENGDFFQDEFLPLVYQQLGERRLLFLFDEFDVLGDELRGEKVASGTLFPYFQNLIMYHRQLVFVFVVGRLIDELPSHFQSIFKQATYRKIGLLKREDARTVIVEPVKDVLDFEEVAIQSILDLTAGHPYLTQLICSEVYNHKRKTEQHTVNDTDVLSLVDKALEHGESALSWFWDGLPPAERFIMSAIAHVTDETGFATRDDIRHVLEKHRVILIGRELQDAPDRLVEWEMLTKVDGEKGYRFVVELVRRWILKAHPLDRALRDIEIYDTRANKMFEVARDAQVRGDLDEAREFYQRTLDANPNHNSAQLGLAQVFYEMELLEQSIATYEAAYKIDDTRARDGLVLAYLAQGKKFENNEPEKALLQYEKALKIAPHHPQIHDQLILFYLEQGNLNLLNDDLASATKNYKQSLNFDDSDNTTGTIKFKLQEYAHMAERKQHFDEAQNTIQSLKDLLPEDKSFIELETQFWVRRGDDFAEKAAQAEAIGAYQHALQLDPSNTIVKEKLEAISVEWEKILEADRLFNKAMVAHQSKNWSQAQEGWQQLIVMNVLNYDDKDIPLLLSQAVTEGNQQRLEQKALFETALIAHQNQQWKEAKESWQKLLNQGVKTYEGKDIKNLSDISSQNLKNKEEQVNTTKGEKIKKTKKVSSLFPLWIWILLAFIIGGIAGVYFWQRNMEQPVTLTGTDPSQWLVPQRNMEQPVTLTGTDPSQWLVVMSDSANVGRQFFWKTNEFPSDIVQENWDKGLDITTIAW